MISTLRNWVNRSSTNKKDPYLEFNTECLERREMLAGDVTVKVRGGNLIIRGDAAGNEITVSHSYSPTGYHVTGQNGTTINGQASFLTTNITGDIRIKLKGGDDICSIVDSSPRDVRFAGSHGNDQLLLGNVNVRGSLRASMGGGEDLVLVDETTVVGSTRLKTSHGRGGILIGGSWLRGNVRVSTGNGQDVLWAVESRFDRDFSAKFKGGEDDARVSASPFFALAKFHGGNGFDDIAIDGVQPPGFVAVSFEGNSPGVGTL